MKSGWPGLRRICGEDYCRPDLIEVGERGTRRDRKGRYEELAVPRERPDEVGSVISQALPDGLGGVRKANVKEFGIGDAGVEADPAVANEIIKTVPALAPTDSKLNTPIIRHIPDGDRW